MAQPPDQSFYHHPQLQLPTQFRNPFDLLFDERTGGLNYNYIRPYIASQPVAPDIRNEPNHSDSLVMRRPRRTRTTFSNAQVFQLEQYFNECKYINSSRLAELSAKLSLGNAQVKIWFKNRRRRLRIQQLKLTGTNDNQLLTSTVVKDEFSTMPLTPTTLTPSPTSTPASTPNVIEPSTENFSYNPFTYNPYAQHAFEQHIRAPVQNQYYQQAQAFNQQLSRDYSTSIIKTEPDHNYNNTTYLRNWGADTIVNHTKTTSKNHFPDLSPISEVYEPLTPKTEGSPKLSNTSDEPINTNNTSAPTYETTKSQPEVGYQCTMDSILQAYNQHRNANNGYNNQFAFCFN